MEAFSTPTSDTNDTVLCGNRAPRRNYRKRGYARKSSQLIAI
jgi:hypothetical protein